MKGRRGCFPLIHLFFSSRTGLCVELTAPAQHFLGLGAALCGLGWFGARVSADPKVLSLGSSWLKPSQPAQGMIWVIFAQKGNVGVWWWIRKRSYNTGGKLTFLLPPRLRRTSTAWPRTCPRTLPPFS